MGSLWGIFLRVESNQREMTNRIKGAMSIIVIPSKIASNWLIVMLLDDEYPNIINTI